MKKLGWIGLGTMGTPMAKNLEKAGYTLSVYNRSIEKTQAFQNSNVSISKNITELVSDSDIIFTMISDDLAVKSVYDEIILHGNISGKIFIDMSKISQTLSQTTAANLNLQNAKFIDAPVVGSTKPATDATLIIMAGGEYNALQIALPYLEKLGKTVKYLGKNGKGIAAKLAINYYVALMYQSLAETVLFAENKGIDRSDFLEIINESALGSGATKLKTPLLINDEYPTQFALNLMIKDILLAKENGVDFPLTDPMIESFISAQKAGYGKTDVISIAKFLKNN
ncbi:NAD(P)-dependent oxidoreductase [Flavobacterium sp. LM4]|uniref:NAD(P)-dependent oxidoreductase n=1 Tax=Flavobacterium sp. LM4 TaxID=1938609 RepID=UPI0009CB110E|nr:NAD(P)-dependent oxidoreductase [Flavobacterium sp. LM4]OOV20456.1 2-hydroxy-3-oxopropionate reductase [Flavobacterium sp. LM4]